MDTARPAAAPVPRAEFYAELREYVGFGEDDSRRLREAWILVEPAMAGIAEEFYERILRNAAARAMLESGESEVGRLKKTLAGWVRELFVGPHDLDHYERHAHVGRRHVELHVGQPYLLMAMNVLRRALHAEIRSRSKAPPASVQATLDSLSKAIDIELAILLESYRDEWVEGLRRGEKLGRIGMLASVGEMASVLSHEMGNSLAGIGGALQILAREEPRDDRRQRVFEAIFDRIRRSETLMRDLLLFSKPITPSYGRVSAASFLERAVALLRDSPSVKGVTWDVAAPPPGLEFRVDEYYLQQAFANLVLNAAQAMTGGGVLRVGIDADGGDVRIFVEDEGPGIPAEALARVFDPFFTTKAHGSGLGLAITRRIVDAHGGEVSLENRPKGVRATLRVPILGDERSRKRGA
jgi:signal transduction histidine kinase